ncbi:MAG TPA: carboxylating nicotinate-nucleotide diphosphorylase, partial [Chthonomonadales bacterium]|nr:carboxylating nicotinate-nucleotide diphosphorylase [Chthonomonadales bacterium]
LPVLEEIYRQIDRGVSVSPSLSDGDACLAGQTIATVTGSVQSLLIGERTALNFLQRLSGIATCTSAFVTAVQTARESAERSAPAGQEPGAVVKARIVDTRKTTPSLRAAEKYAVRMGGGYNHRSGLYDAVLIKDNHILAAGDISSAVQLALDGAPHTVTVTVECDTLAQVEEAVNAGADIVMLDNMPVELLAQAVKLVDGNACVEASGRVTLESVGAIAETGVDVISVGALTHSAPALDIALDLAF